MFFRRTIAKRLLAQCGVCLTLAASLQQTGSLCNLASCTCFSMATHVAVEVSEESHTACSHQHGRHSHHTAARHDSDHHGDSASHGGWPCEHDCWCCQPPAPQQQPAPLDADALTQPAATAATLAIVAPALAFASSPPATGAATAPERAIDACARLCRFLT